jgi:hypothetical protein
MWTMHLVYRKIAVSEHNRAIASGDAAALDIGALMVSPDKMKQHTLDRPLPAQLDPPPRPAQLNQPPRLPARLDAPH